MFSFCASYREEREERVAEKTSVRFLVSISAADRTRPEDLPQLALSGFLSPISMLRIATVVLWLAVFTNSTVTKISGTAKTEITATFEEKLPKRTSEPYFYMKSV